MEFIETELEGAFLIVLSRIEDNRGFFARGWCQDEFSKHGLIGGMVQLNVGFSHKKGTLRGLHYQLPPHQEAKLARCTRGAIFDVVVDLRPGSSTYKRWFGAELTAANGRMLYVPEGCAHGYQTMADDTEMYYLTSAAYAASSATGVRYNDSAFGIAWPLEVEVISGADAAWPDYVPVS
jgi:dTDP-4-dehydrorhamnose 3,5-epimerase